MQEAYHNEFELVPYDSSVAGEAFALIQWWAKKQDGDLVGAFNSTTKLYDFCRVVKKNGELYAVLYPDFNAFAFPHSMKIHAVLTSKACACRDNQVIQFRKYLEQMFDKGLHKAIIEFPTLSRLTKKIIEPLGFVKEGVKRLEWFCKGTYYDIHIYGLLATEFRGLR